ncbi:MAG: 3D domain-containing protein [Acidimicrobiales bacterium]
MPSPPPAAPGDPGSTVPGDEGYRLATAPTPPPPPSSSVSAASLGTPLGTFVITCYSLGGTTASGAPAGPSTVAVDPSVIPLGTHIYVGGAGARVAEDTGGAIVGRRLDIWEPSYAQCADWGVQSREVWLQG